MRVDRVDGEPLGACVPRQPDKKNLPVRPIGKKEAAAVGDRGRLVPSSTLGLQRRPVLSFLGDRENKPLQPMLA